MPQLAATTIMRGGERSDLAVPAGTTVAGLAAMLRLDISDQGTHITQADGSPAEASAVLGRDIPSGSVLSITNSKDSIRAETRAHAEQDQRWFHDSVHATTALLFVMAVELLALVAPLCFREIAVSTWGRLLAAALSVLVGLGVVTNSKINGNAFGLVAVPLMFGLPWLAFLPANIPSPVPLAVVVSLCGAFVAALLIWLAQPKGASGFSPLLWGGSALIVCTAVSLDLDATFVFPLLLALAVVMLRVSPEFTVRIPESQLIDLPRLLTSATKVRPVETSAPSRITTSRVNRTVADAQLRFEATVVFSITGILISAPWTMAAAGAGSWQRWGALTTLLLGVTVLLLVPRSYRSRLARTLPRIGALGLLVAIAGIAFRDQWGSPVAIGLVLMLGAGLLVLLSVSYTAGPPSALLGRLGDIAQRLAAALILPAAGLGSGLFDLIWQVSS